MSLTAMVALLQSVLALLQVMQLQSALPPDIRAQAEQLVRQAVMEVTASSTDLFLATTTASSLQNASSTVGSDGLMCPSGYVLYGNGHFGYSCQALGGTDPTTAGTLPCKLGAEGCVDVYHPPSSYLAAPMPGPYITTPYTIPDFKNYLPQNPQATTTNVVPGS